MEKVSGDFFDLIPMPGDSLGVLVADVMGHGIPAALVTTMAKITFQEQCRRNTRLDEIFYHVNRELCDNVPGPEYLTAFLIRLEKDGTVHYANASHCNALVYRAATHSIEKWDTDGLFIGAIREKDMKYEFKTDKLEYGDKIILMTDGIIEHKNEDGEEFGMERIEEIILSNADKSPQEIQEAVLENFQKFKGESKNQDDLTFFVLERDPKWKDYMEKKDLVLDYLSWKQTSEALQVLQNLKDSGFEDPTLDLYFGKAWYLQENYPEAIRYLSKFHNTGQNHFEAALMLASAYYNQKEYSKAFDIAQDALNLNRNSAQANYLAGMSLLKMQKYEDAIHYLKKAVDLNPQDDNYLSALRKAERRNNR
ncbi:MAG: tetratricopeptide repeat protein [Candidatus Hydrogenedentota bacterium]|nr:MAG: tetratricopeptide repeat protein [Candidatus Hydrogenedentota bacterium]